MLREALTPAMRTLVVVFRMGGGRSACLTRWTAELLEPVRAESAIAPSASPVEACHQVTLRRDQKSHGQCLNTQCISGLGGVPQDDL